MNKKEDNINYLESLKGELIETNKDKKIKNYRDIWRAWLRYCQRPKTLFDLKDRTKAVILLVLVIIVGQIVVQYILNWYNN